MNFPFFIARRYLISKKSHTAVNIISGISVLGICVGTMALIIILSAFNGFADLVQSLDNSFCPEIEITVKQGKTFNPGDTEFEALKKLEGVAFFTEVAEGNALLKLNDKQCIATIKGVSSQFRKMSGFDSLIVEGKFSLEKNNVIIGKGIRDVLQTSSNDFFTPVSVYAPKRGSISTLNPEEGLNELRVFPTAVFSITDDFDYKYVIMNIDKARALLDYTTEATSVELKLSPQANKEAVQQQLLKILGNKYEVKNREQQNALLYKTMKVEKLWVFIILVFMLIIGTFNVIGTLTMLILEKKKDIKTLNSLGADIRLIRKIFLAEGIMITIVGVLSGLVLGLLICWLQINYSLVPLREGFLVNAYPVKVHPADIFEISAVVLLIGFIATWYPVRYFTKKHLINLV